MTDPISIDEMLPALHYLAFSPEEKEAYSVPIDFSTTFHMSEADASFGTFSEFMLSVAENQVGKVLGYIEMGNELAPPLAKEQIIALEELWNRLDDALNYRVSDKDLAAVKSSWWSETSALATYALQILGDQVRMPAINARAILDDWSLGQYSKDHPE